MVCGIRGDWGLGDMLSGDDWNSLYMSEITKEQESFENVKWMNKLCLSKTRDIICTKNLFSIKEKRKEYMSENHRNIVVLRNC